MTRSSRQRHRFSSENWAEQACTYVVLIVDDSRCNDCDYLLRTYTTCRRLWGLTEVHSLMAETVVGFALLGIMGVVMVSLQWKAGKMHDIISKLELDVICNICCFKRTPAIRR